MSSPTERTFEFSRYAEAVQRQQRLLREAEDASRALDQANTDVREEEERMKEALEMSFAEVRVYAKRELARD